MAALERRTLREQLVDGLRHEIASGGLPAGAALVEAALTARFEVSRSTVREALRELHEQGLVVHRPRTGTFVRQLRPDEISGLYDVRAAIEGRAARSVARSVNWAVLADQLEERVDAMHKNRAASFLDRVDVDLAFHRALCELSGNTSLVRCWEHLAAQVQTVLSAMGPTLLGPLMSPGDHLIFVDVIRARDEPAIQETIDRVMAHSARELEAVLTDPTRGTSSFDFPG